MANYREVRFYRDHFEEFFKALSKKEQFKLLWTLKIVEELRTVPAQYMKHISNSSGLYEIRSRVGSDISRVFCFFHGENILVIGHGFRKKSQKTPRNEILRAEKIKAQFYEEL